MILLAFLWIAWCVLHSLLIGRPAEKIAGRLLGRYAGAYRFLYVLFSLATLIPLLLYQFSLPQAVLLRAGLPIRFLQHGLLIYGLVMLYQGARVYDLRFFLGITQWRSMRRNKPLPPLAFRTNGILARIRHPWYSGGIAVIWGFGEITDVFLVTRIILTVYLLVGALLEEKRLAAKLGERYIAYRRKVPMLLPGPRRPSSPGFE
ncbi:MAG TPA: hypothetical protein ENN06_05555 [Desulfobacteraceae bacterium]|nr:hypothetical protein [Desulfobacteraceae bacterium]